MHTHSEVERAPAQKWWTQGRKSRRTEAAAAAAETSAVMRSQRQRIQRALGAAVDADPPAAERGAPAGPQAAEAGFPPSTPGPAGSSGPPAAQAAAAGEAFSPFANLPTPEEYWAAADAGEVEVLSPAALDADAQREWRAFLKEAKGDTARPAAGPARSRWSGPEVAGRLAGPCAGSKAQNDSGRPLLGVPRGIQRPLRCTKCGWKPWRVPGGAARAPITSRLAFQGDLWPAEVCSSPAEQRADGAAPRSCRRTSGGTSTTKCQSRCRRCTRRATSGTPDHAAAHAPRAAWASAAAC